MATQKVRHIKPPRGTTAKASQYKGKPGEIVIDMEAKELRIHDGITAGGHTINSGSGALIAWDEAVTGRIISLMAQQVQPVKVMSIWPFPCAVSTPSNLGFSCRVKLASQHSKVSYDS